MTKQPEDWLDDVPGQRSRNCFFQNLALRFNLRDYFHCKCHNVESFSEV